MSARKVKYERESDLHDPANALPVTENKDGTTTAAFRGCKHLVFGSEPPAAYFERNLIAMDEKRSEEGKFYVMWMWPKTGAMVQFCGKRRKALCYPYACVRDSGNAMCEHYKKHDHVVTFREPKPPAAVQPYEGRPGVIAFNNSD